ncbi:tetraprenyl-beta-curcumene synthase family protein [Caldanaerobius polysaccharolyticus]|uniref:tetraprenyl-beta-curcumene synthase family protein n=1 Tax=Caldanaerobius polysaccharolyticus TaxID=44256 RepID=UPI00047CFC66|nr:tetraprenyl-beta-curcumene synthase family protein [Caldanaerobius polysaccharolyticus]
MDLKGRLYQMYLIYNYVAKVFPKVDGELKKFVQIAKRIPDAQLSKQALNSIKSKKFHCIGGCVYALYPFVDQEKLISFITAYQTISDYLDNLCDRAGVWDEVAFRQLHKAMTDALDLYSEKEDYYKYYAYKEDGGYLSYLVDRCRNYVTSLPSYCVVREEMLKLASLYADLQVYKHLLPSVREKKMNQWFKLYIGEYPDINGWEFSAATGSTLGVFVLAAEAQRRDLNKNEVKNILNAYFPWISALHILLDYYIDLYEDLKEGDLNFVSYYSGDDECRQRLEFFLANSLKKAEELKYPLLHRTAVEGLIAMYLSDPKACIYEHKNTTRHLIRRAGKFARLLYHMCLGLRKVSILS